MIRDPLRNQIDRVGAVRGSRIVPLPVREDRRRLARRSNPGPAPRIVDDSWKVLAGCAGLPTSWWVMDQDARPGSVALSICGSCLVSRQCLRTVLELERADDWTGIHAGTMAADRSAVRRRVVA